MKNENNTDDFGEYDPLVDYSKKLGDWLKKNDVQGWNVTLDPASKVENPTDEQINRTAYDALRIFSGPSVDITEEVLKGWCTGVADHCGVDCFKCAKYQSKESGKSVR